MSRTWTPAQRRAMSLRMHEIRQRKHWTTTPSTRRGNYMQTLEGRARHSEAMKQAWARKPWATRKKQQQSAQQVKDWYKEPNTPSIGDVEKMKAGCRAHHEFVTGMTQQPTAQQSLTELFNVAEERFPTLAYTNVLKECQAIVADRDTKGRNTYAKFDDGFPHGLSDLTFETYRRVMRVLGIEKQLMNGLAQSGASLRKVMREDLLDLCNYAAFAVMRLDKDSQEYP